MALQHLKSFLIVGAGAAGLMAARELACAGKQVIIVEARDRCGGRIYPLPVEEFGYPAEGGAEFVHGTASVTRSVMREAQLSLLRRAGTRWNARSGTLRADEPSFPHADRFYQALTEVKADLPIAEFLEKHFAGWQYDELRQSVTRTVEGYDAADPQRFSTLALRDEWTARDDGEHGRIAGGYGALIEYLASECRKYGAAIHFGAAVAVIDEVGRRVTAHCRDGRHFDADAAIITVPLPLLREIALPTDARQQAAVASDIGYGNVVKLLFRFATKWWADIGRGDLADLSFLLSNATVPTWWTQHSEPHLVLTGWYAGPKADRVSSLSETQLIEMGLVSLAEIFGVPVDRIRNDLVASRAINWGNDSFARGAYSYATPQTRQALSVLRKPGSGVIFFSGEAFYAGPNMGTVEAALASGQETVQMILTSG